MGDPLPQRSEFVAAERAFRGTTVFRVQRFTVAVFLLGACSVACAQGARPGVPIENYDNRPISTASGKVLPPATIRALFVSAGDRYEWEFTDMAPDRLLGTVAWRNKHKIQVEISYSAERYSIRYLSSENMNYVFGYGNQPQSYPGAFGQTPGRSNMNQVATPLIHPEYNKRVKQLVERFEFELRKQ